MSTNQDVGATIQRCPHDEENPYTQVLNALIRDKTISPNCRMIIIYLLSNRNNWVIRIPQLINEFKGHIGRELMYKLVDEAMEAGYLKREDYTENNLKRCKYYLSEKPKFKKILRHPDLPDAGVPPPGRQDCKERTSKERTMIDSDSLPPEAATRVENKIKIDIINQKPMFVGIEDLMTMFIQHRQETTKEEIDELFKKLQDYKDPVRDFYTFCDTIIKNMRKSIISKEIKLKESKCQQKTYNTKNNTTNTNKKPSIEKSKTTNDVTSTKNTSERPLANWRSLLGFPERYPTT
jgi:hypothetical protein